MIVRKIVVQAALFDGVAEAAAMAEGRTNVGAVVTFTGYCRDEAGSLEALELEHYPGMAETELERIADEAERRWPLLGTIVIHRFGVIRPGEPIVFVAAASSHRAAAFAATDFLMDFLKSEAPFWKREHRKAEAAHPASSDAWVGAKDSDAVAMDRWR